MDVTLSWRCVNLMYIKVIDEFTSDMNNIHIKKTPELILMEMQVEMEEFLDSISKIGNPIDLAVAEYSMGKCREDIKSIVDNKEQSLRIIASMIAENNQLSDAAIDPAKEALNNLAKRN